MCNLTISSILQKPNKQLRYGVHAYISLRGDEGVKQCTRAFRACSFTAWSSRLKCIKNDRKIQDMGGRKFIYLHFIWLKSHKKYSFFSKNKHDYKCDIDFIQQFNKQ